MLYHVKMSWTDMDRGYNEEYRSFTASSESDAVQHWKEHYQCGGESYLSRGDKLIACSYRGEVEELT